MKRLFLAINIGGNCFELKCFLLFETYAETSGESIDMIYVALRHEVALTSPEMEEKFNFQKQSIHIAPKERLNTQCTESLKNVRTNPFLYNNG